MEKIIRLYGEGIRLLATILATLQLTLLWIQGTKCSVNSTIDTDNHSDNHINRQSCAADYQQLVSHTST